MKKNNGTALITITRVSPCIYKSSPDKCSTPIALRTSQCTITTRMMANPFKSVRVLLYSFVKPIIYLLILRSKKIKSIILKRTILKNRRCFNGNKCEG